MEEPFTLQNLRNFIRKFTNSSLERVVTTTLKLPTYSPDNIKVKPTLPTWEKKMDELTTITFLPTVLKQNKVVVIMYYSPKCGFCTGVAHVLLSVARLLSPLKRLQFARIDGDSHSLPWEYTMYHYPTILLFPAQR